MNIKSKDGKRQITLDATEQRALRKASGILVELSELTKLSEYRDASAGCDAARVAFTAVK